MKWRKKDKQSNKHIIGSIFRKRKRLRVTSKQSINNYGATISNLEKGIKDYVKMKIK